MLCWYMIVHRAVVLREERVVVWSVNDKALGLEVVFLLKRRRRRRMRVSINTIMKPQ